MDEMVDTGKRESVQVVKLNVDDLKWLMLEVMGFLKYYEEDRFVTFKGQSHT